MPSKDVIKTYISGGVYHVYNRGNESRDVFLDEEDFHVFMYLLDHYLCPPIPGVKTRNYFGKIKLLVFCLMTNHIHLLLVQQEERVVDKFMHGLLTSYAMRMNKKYKRVGHVFQGVYKARLLESDLDLINISRYIHLNPFEEAPKELLYPYSSLGCYVKQWELEFVDTTMILNLFGGSPELYKRYLLG